MTGTVKFSKYDPTTGKILFNAEVPESMLGLQGGNIILGESNIKMNFVINGVLANRPANTVTISKTTVAANMTDTVVLSGIPSGAKVNVVGQVSTTTTADGSDVSLTFAVAGTYKITIESFPITDQEFIVNAT